jgi:hypothetical protein
MIMSFPVHNVRVVHRDRAECFTITVNVRCLIQEAWGMEMRVRLATSVCAMSLQQP